MPETKPAEVTLAISSPDPDSNTRTSTCHLHTADVVTRAQRNARPWWHSPIGRSLDWRFSLSLCHQQTMRLCTALTNYQVAYNLWNFRTLNKVAIFLKENPIPRNSCPCCRKTYLNRCRRLLADWQRATRYLKESSRHLLNPRLIHWVIKTWMPCFYE